MSIIRPFYYVFFGKYQFFKSVWLFESIFEVQMIFPEYTQVYCSKYEQLYSEMISWNSHNDTLEDQLLKSF